MESLKKDKRRRLTGRVVGCSMSKTVVVAVDSYARHPRYGKYLKFVRKVMVHDENSSAAIGDVVEIISSKPISRLKRWALKDIIRKSSGDGLGLTSEI